MTEDTEVTVPTTPTLTDFVRIYVETAEAAGAGSGEGKDPAGYDPKKHLEIIIERVNSEYPDGIRWVDDGDEERPGTDTSVELKVRGVNPNSQQAGAIRVSRAHVRTIIRGAAIAATMLQEEDDEGAGELQQAIRELEAGTKDIKSLNFQDFEKLKLAAESLYDAMERDGPDPYRSEPTPYGQFLARLAWALTKTRTRK